MLSNLNLNIPKRLNGLVEKRREVLQKRKAIMENGHRKAVSIVEERLKSDEGFQGFVRAELKRSNELVDTRRSFELELIGLFSDDKSKAVAPKLIKDNSE